MAKTVQVKVSGIKWDGPKNRLPKDITLEIDGEINLDDEEDVQHEIDETLASDYGYCTFGYSYIVVKPIVVQAGD